MNEFVIIFWYHVRSYGLYCKDRLEKVGGVSNAKSGFIGQYISKIPINLSLEEKNVF